MIKGHVVYEVPSPSTGRQSSPHIKLCQEQPDISPPHNGTKSIGKNICWPEPNIDQVFLFFLMTEYRIFHHKSNRKQCLLFIEDMSTYLGSQGLVEEEMLKRGSNNWPVREKLLNRAKSRVPRYMKQVSGVPGLGSEITIVTYVASFQFVHSWTWSSFAYYLHINNIASLHFHGSLSHVAKMPPIRPDHPQGARYRV